MLLGRVAADVRLGRGRHLPGGGRRRAPALPHARTWPSCSAPAMATIGVFGCHLAGDWFLGVDILVTSMLDQLPADGAVGAGPAVRAIPALAAAVIVLPSRGRSRCPWRGRRASCWRCTWPCTPGATSPARPRVVLQVDAGVGHRDGAGHRGLLARDAPAARPGRGCGAPASPPCLRSSAVSARSNRIDAGAWTVDLPRVVTGLWQIADMERDGRTLDLDAAARAMTPYVDAGFTVVRHGRPLRLGRDHRRQVPRAAGDADRRAALHQVGAQARAR